MKIISLTIQREIMPTVASRKERSDEIAVVKKMRDYSNEPAFKKKAEKAMSFLKKQDCLKLLQKRINNLISLN